MNKTEFLNQLLAEQLGQQDLGCYVQYRQRHGWWLIYDEARYIGDDGTFLGVDWKHAEKTLKRMF